ncbi:hypothetical protein VB638_14770 [Dolichospermum sp. UHCC 0684]|jgi:hypothetical protein|uniref:hypothetical protein n=1 Tax=Nostocales TaxID=1161 RepID=UPI00029B5970|nr:MULTISPECIES: hypothetical protein [Nostocales]MBO1051554.1 hypothetical protein [Dolichospermum sp. DET73]MBS9385102.1 hypothetical protein [Dolichospermum sp. BR01]MBS9394394.1 hypothetical protein [Dolichospermum sp. OL01]MCO5798024.1 hypothetical protein [Dolichospermum sp. OL03]MCS6283414.1 hypothetical protein [Dolichospermum sp.]QSV59502.1 MAG: hypothetical protein HEQ29_15060 [Dolichospermum sp. LBC05a]
MDELNKQLSAFGISPEEISKQLSSMGISFDEIAKKTASIGVPSIILAVAFTSFGGTGLTVTLATALAGSIGVIGDNLTGYGIEMILTTVYVERRKTEAEEALYREIDILPLTDALKIKLKSQLAQVKVTDNTTDNISTENSANGSTNQNSDRCQVEETQREPQQVMAVAK